MATKETGVWHILQLQKTNLFLVFAVIERHCCKYWLNIKLKPRYAKKYKQNICTDDLWVRI